MHGERRQPDLHPPAQTGRRNLQRPHGFSRPSAARPGCFALRASRSRAVRQRFVHIIGAQTLQFVGQEDLAAIGARQKQGRVAVSVLRVSGFAAPIPEPSPSLLMALGLSGCLLAARRRG